MFEKTKYFVKAAFILHLKKWVFPQPNHKWKNKATASIIEQGVHIIWAVIKGKE